MTKKIEKSYLMWIGAIHYKTIGDYVKEALEQGISKRTVNGAVAKTLVEPGTVVFLAHDEGDQVDCPECQGTIECPECRKIQNELDKLLEEKKSVIEHKEDATLERYEKLFSRVQKRIEKRTNRMDNCQSCDGSRRAEAGTGGSVEYNDGSEHDFRQYMYWLRQPKKWTPEDLGGILEMDMCKNCGGKGVLPQGRVFGMFLPVGVEYILKPEDDEAVKKEMEKKGFKTVTLAQLKTEPDRGCGRRKPGGYYVVTTNSEKLEEETKKKIQELVEAGLIKDVETTVTGSFAEFLNPVEIEAKRFRGLKRWSLDPRVEDEAELILDATE